MKYGRIIITIAAGLAFCLTAVFAAAEEMPPLRDVHALLERAHPGYEIVAQDNRGDRIAMILQREADNILCVAQWDDEKGDYVLTIDNTNAVYDDMPLPRISLGSVGDELYIIYHDDVGNSLHLHSYEQNGIWGAVDSIYYESYGGERVRVKTASVRDGMLRYGITTEDENGNILAVHERAPIPVSDAFEQEMLLESFDLNMWDVDPIYGLFNTGRREGFMDGLLPQAGCEVLCTDLQSGYVLTLTQEADGNRYLYVAKWDDGDYEAVWRTKALPDNTSMDAYHTGDGELYLARDGGVLEYGFALENGVWRLNLIRAEHDLIVGPDYIFREDMDDLAYRRNDGYAYGAHPWRNLLELDLASLPGTIDEAAKLIRTHDYALVNNPNPEDRLHLRAEPKKGAKSLGKFYNRTPVRVLGSDGEWKHVQIGTGSAVLEGYMMSEFLAVDEVQKARVKCAFPTKVLRPEFKDGLLILREPKGGAGSDAEGVFTGEPYDFIIGVVDNEWYVVLRGDGSVGYVLQSAFYDGNG